MSFASPRISVVACSLNERAAVAKVIPEIRRALGPGAEIVLVDSSSDGTDEVARRLGATVIRQVPPQGYGRAMKAGMLAARGRTIVTMDCDATYPASRIMDMVELIESDRADVVGATRMARRQRTMPSANRLANRLFAALTRLVTGVQVTDVTTGMRAYRRSLLRAVRWDTEYVLPICLLVSTLESGARYREVEVEYGSRLGDVTLNRLQSGVNSLLYILLCRVWRPWWLREDASRASACTAAVTIGLPERARTGGSR